VDGMVGLYYDISMLNFWTIASLPFRYAFLKGGVFFVILHVGLFFRIEVTGFIQMNKLKALMSQ
jgi:hypothetical protein